MASCFLSGFVEAVAQGLVSGVWRPDHATAVKIRSSSHRARSVSPECHAPEVRIAGSRSTFHTKLRCVVSREEGRVIRPPSDETLMITPLPAARIKGRTSCVIWMTPIRFVSTSRRISAGDAPSSGPNNPKPALLTSTSTPPHLLTVSSIADCIESYHSRLARRRVHRRWRSHFAGWAGRYGCKFGERAYLAQRRYLSQLDGVAGTYHLVARTPSA